MPGWRMRPPRPWRPPRCIVVRPDGECANAALHASAHRGRAVLGRARPVLAAVRRLPLLFARLDPTPPSRSREWRNSAWSCSRSASAARPAAWLLLTLLHSGTGGGPAIAGRGPVELAGVRAAAALRAVSAGGTRRRSSAGGCWLPLGRGRAAGGVGLAGAPPRRYSRRLGRRGTRLVAAWLDPAARVRGPGLGGRAVRHGGRGMSLAAPPRQALTRDDWARLAGAIAAGHCWPCGRIRARSMRCCATAMPRCSYRRRSWTAPIRPCRRRFPPPRGSSAWCATCGGTRRSAAPMNAPARPWPLAAHRADVGAPWVATGR